MLPILTIIHPLVDACSMSVLASGSMSWQRILLYNALAFALQLPLGVLLDARPRLVRGGFLVGTCLVSAATFAAACGANGWGVLSAVCIGNAFFHLTAGKHVLESHGGRSGPIGLFISTGALGLLAGQLGVEHAAKVCMPTFAGLLAICVVAAPGMNGRDARSPSATSGTPVAPVVILIGLFMLVAWRSWAGLEASRLTAAEGMSLLLAGAAVTWGGKAAGGYLAERIGRWTVTGASVCGSVTLAFACSPQSAIAWLVLLFVAQLATGPVLSLVYDRTGQRGGTAFGLNCLGLFAGSL